MKQAAERAHIQGLLSLGLAPPAFITARLETLPQLIPSDPRLFDWTDRHGRPWQHVFDGPIASDINRRHFEHFHNRAEPHGMPSSQQVLTGGASVRGAAALEQAASHCSARYQGIWRPQGLHSRIEGIVRTEAGVPLGSRVLYRGPGGPRFSRADEPLLGPLLPYVPRGSGQPARTGKRLGSLRLRSLPTAGPRGAARRSCTSASATTNPRP